MAHSLSPKKRGGRIADIIAVLDSVFDPNAMKPDDARKNNVEVTLDKDKMDSRAFSELWSRINSKSRYTVAFKENELIEKAIAELNARLRVSKIYFKVEQGEQVKDIVSREQLQSGGGFIRTDIVREEVETYSKLKVSTSVRYDLIGKIVAETGLTRKTAVSILTGISKTVFSQFSDNPEEFIIRASAIINEQKATAIIAHITYDKLTAVFSTDIFTEPDLKKGKLGVNAMETKRHLYDYVIYDSAIERDFAASLEKHKHEVEVYVKLPKGFYISTPVGKYNPDWAIAFYEGKVKHIYFVAETKGDMSSSQQKGIEEAKAHCAEKHFCAISGENSEENIVYRVVDSYEALWNLARQ